MNYYHRFIKNCPKVAKPLTELTKNIPFNWFSPADNSFKALKKAIFTATVLAQFDPQKKIFVTTDACKYAIGAVMEQDHEDGRHPVAFISRTLNQHEQNYAPHDLELLGIVDTLRTWIFYLHRQNFVVHTDHHTLKYLQTQKFLIPRQDRWLERISMFNFDIVPVREKSNQVAGVLSRQKSIPTGTKEYSKELFNKILQKTSFMGAMSTLKPGSRLTNTLISEYQDDKLSKELLRQPKELFEVRNGLLYLGSRLCIPEGPTRIKLLHDNHSTPCTGHLGKTKTLNRLLSLYY